MLEMNGKRNTKVILNLEEIEMQREIEKHKTHVILYSVREGRTKDDEESNLRRFLEYTLGFTHAQIDNMSYQDSYRLGKQIEGKSRGLLVIFREKSDIEQCIKAAAATHKNWLVSLDYAKSLQ